jgi:hypothetical protein
MMFCTFRIAFYSFTLFSIRRERSLENALHNKLNLSPWTFSTFFPISRETVFRSVKKIKDDLSIERLEQNWMLWAAINEANDAITLRFLKCAKPTVADLLWFLYKQRNHRVTWFMCGVLGVWGWGYDGELGRDSEKVGVWLKRRKQGGWSKVLQSLEFRWLQQQLEEVSKTSRNVRSEGNMKTWG